MLRSQNENIKIDSIIVAAAPWPVVYIALVLSLVVRILQRQKLRELDRRKANATDEN